MPKTSIRRIASYIRLITLPWNLPPLGSKIQKRSKQQQTRKEKEHQEVHQGALNGGGHVPSLFQV
jgi:hypothetical protein